MSHTSQLLMTIAIVIFINLAVSATALAAEQTLGKELTAMGAIREGNGDAIPDYDGGLRESPGERVIPGAPFAEDEPLFHIDQTNLEDHREHLSPGQVAMIERYEDYVIPVYRTRRTAAYPDAIRQQTMENEGSVELIANGNGLENYESGTPFPVPENGLEAIWNHITRYRGGSLRRQIARTTPDKDGDFTVTRLTEDFTYPTALVDYADGEHENILFYFRQQVTSPSRLAGNILLVYETINQRREPRKAWVYNSGQRRVRRAPDANYDAQAGSGQATADNLDMFNGATDRYEWELLGRKTKYIPYNAYRLASPELSYDDIIQAGHIDQSLARYELHRVWHVRATLKDGERHVYSRRDFYIDEDSWQIAIADHYDGRGELWRVAEAHMVQIPGPDVPGYAFETLYDLQSGRYVINGLTNEESTPYQFDTRKRHWEYTPAALRRGQR
ncbi:MAG: DUF1329 domain-containing protein [Pseudomonadota bacterium]